MNIETKKSFERHTEQRYYGRNLCKTLFEQRPQDIISVNIVKELLHEFGPLLKWCAEQRKAYHVMDREQLDTITKSSHHEGVVVLARKKLCLTQEEFLSDLQSAPEKACVVFLDGVENPHNIGAILRSAANFGVKAVLFSDDKIKSLPSASCRVSEGASELIHCYSVKESGRVLRAIAEAGFVVVGTSSTSKANLFVHNFAKRCCVVLGSEATGMKSETNSGVQVTLRIPGTGAVQSLNVASAASILFAEYWRQTT
jgi:TrmH RNA methyltransferase